MTLAHEEGQRIRLAIAGLALLSGLPLLSGCGPGTPDSTHENISGPGPAANQVDAAPRIVRPVELAPLARKDIVAAASAAADAAARGQPLPETNRALVDRKFLLAMPIGCAGADQDDWSSWTYNSMTGAVKVSARNEQWQDAPWLPQIASAASHEAIEGFWIRRPWTSAESCLPIPDPPPPVDPAATRQTLALAQFFSRGSPRTLRRAGRPFSITYKARPGLSDTEWKFSLVLRGKISAFPDGQPVHCRSKTPELAPVCIIAAAFQNIALRDDTSGERIAEWGL